MVSAGSRSPRVAADILPTETAHITKREAKRATGLSCQVSVKQDMDLELPAEIFAISKWECSVRSNESRSTFIKELVLELPEGEDLAFRAGGYIQIDAPPHVVEYRTMEIAEEYQRRLGQIQPLAVPVRSRRTDHARLFDGQLS